MTVLLVELSHTHTWGQQRFRSFSHLRRVVNGVTEGEKGVRRQANPGKLLQERLLIFRRQGLRDGLEVRLPRHPLGGSDVALDVSANGNVCISWTRDVKG